MSGRALQHEWCDVLTHYVPPTGPPPALQEGHSGSPGNSRPATISFTDEYNAVLAHRLAIIKRHQGHPAINFYSLWKCQSAVNWAPNQDAAGVKFEMFETEMVAQLEALSHAAFVGPDDDATEEDMTYSDQFQE